MSDNKLNLNLTSLSLVCEKSNTLFSSFGSNGYLQVFYDITSGRVWADYLSDLSHCHRYLSEGILTIDFISGPVSESELLETVWRVVRRNGLAGA